MDFGRAILGLASLPVGLMRSNNLGMDLFSQSLDLTEAPLAERLRPQALEELLGQERALHDSGLLRLIRSNGRIPNLILWGPPGTGKTTFARLLARQSSAHWESVNAIDTGAKALREIGEASRVRRLQLGQSTLLFIDEIHRLNKSQQDVLLPYSERGDLTLIGATTENPSYELNAALLSRCRVVTFSRLAEVDLEKLLERGARALGMGLDEVLEPEARHELLRLADGDGRRLLVLFENLVLCRPDVTSPPLKLSELHQQLQRQPQYYDKTGEEHYDCISAFIKSVRGSDPDAAVYYLSRMLEGGEDPIFIARRLVILASEDIGNADPRGLSVAVAGLQATELIGLPEAAISLAQVTTYLASAPKSNRSYMALNRARECVQATGRLPIPLSLRSSKTKLSQSLGYGKDYGYSHDGERGYLRQDFLPSELKDKKFYDPVDRGFEKNIRAYLEWVRQQPLAADAEAIEKKAET